MAYEDRRVVSSEEFATAWKDQNTRRVLLHLSRKLFRAGLLDRDECRSAAMQALWRTLQYHDEAKSPFVMNLMRFAKWEFRRFLRDKHRSSRELCLSASRSIHRRSHESDVDETDLLETMLNKLPYDWMKTLIRLRYIDECSYGHMASLTGKSVQAVVRRTKKAVDALRFAMTSPLSKSVCGKCWRDPSLSVKACPACAAMGKASRQAAYRLHRRKVRAMGTQTIA